MGLTTCMSIDLQLTIFFTKFSFVFVFCEVAADSINILVRLAPGILMEDTVKTYMNKRGVLDEVSEPPKNCDALLQIMESPIKILCLFQNGNLSAYLKKRSALFANKVAEQKRKFWKNTSPRSIRFRNIL